MHILDQIERANARGVGQFHVCDKHGVVSTWHSLEVARSVAARNGQWVYNDNGKVA